eukprot:CFRG1411T1
MCVPDDTEALLEQLCESLPMYDTTRMAALKYLHSLEAKVGASELKTNLPTWAVCSILLASGKGKDPTPELAHMLLSQNISMIEFISKLRGVCDNMSLETDMDDVDLSKLVEDLDRQFEVVSCIFRKFEVIFAKVFKPNTTANEEGSLGPIFSFAWLLFLISKDHLLRKTYDLVDSIHLLISVVVFTAQQAPQDAFTPDMDAVLLEATDSIDEEVLMEMLCELVNAQTSVVNVVKTAFHKYLENLINKPDTITFDAPHAIQPRRIRTRSTSYIPENESGVENGSKVELETARNMAGAYIQANIDYLNNLYESNPTDPIHFDERMYLNPQFLKFVVKGGPGEFSDGRHCASTSESHRKSYEHDQPTDNKKNISDHRTARSRLQDQQTLENSKTNKKTVGIGSSVSGSGSTSVTVGQASKATTAPKSSKKLHPAIRIIKEEDEVGDRDTICGEEDDSMDTSNDAPSDKQQPTTPPSASKRRGNVDSISDLSADDMDPKTPPPVKRQRTSVSNATPLSYRYANRETRKQFTMQTPTKTAMASTAVLKQLTAGISEKSMMNVLDIRTGTKNSPRRNNVEVITKRLDGMSKIFSARYEERRGKDSLAVGQAHFDMGRKLYIRVLTNMLAKERKRLSPSVYEQLINQEEFHKALIACALEVVISSFGLSEMSCDWLLEAFDLCPYNFLKVTESFVRAEEQLTRSQLKHMAAIEERMLESVVWRSGGRIFEELRDKNVPRWVDCAPPSQSQTRPLINKLATVETRSSAYTPNTPNATTALPRPGAPAVVGSSGTSMSTSQHTTETINTLLTVAQASAPPGVGVVAQTSPNVASASASTVSDLSRIANKGVHLFFRKVYNLVYIRLEELCDALALNRQDVQPRVWRLIEDTFSQHIEILTDRHLDQILLCALFAVGKTLNIPNFTFKRIVVCYRKQPYMEIGTFRSALLADGVTRGSIIEFYNQVYTAYMSESILQSSELSPSTMIGSSPIPCPLSKRQQALWSSPSMKHHVSNSHKVFVAPMRSMQRLFGSDSTMASRALSPSTTIGPIVRTGTSVSRKTYTVGESPTTVLSEINRAVSNDAHLDYNKSTVIGGGALHTMRNMRDLAQASEKARRDSIQRLQRQVTGKDGSKNSKTNTADSSKERKKPSSISTLPNVSSNLVPEGSSISQVSNTPCPNTTTDAPTSDTNNVKSKSNHTASINTNAALAPTSTSSPM